MPHWLKGDKTDFKEWEGTPYFGAADRGHVAERGPTLRHRR